MPKKNAVPSYRRHSARNSAVVRINGQDHYLGEWQSPESHERYARLIAAWRRGELDTTPRPAGLTVGGFSLKYLEHAKRYYRKQGRETNQVSNVKTALKHCCALWATLPIEQLSPLKLQAVIDHMIAADCSRSYVNKLLVCVKIAIKWGVSQELIPPAVLHAAQSVNGLRRGRTTARETAPVLPADPKIVAGVREHLSPTVRAMVDVMLLTGARCGEVCQMRGCDLEVEPGGETAVFVPQEHKTEHHGKRRWFVLGPQAMAAVGPLMASRAACDYLFSPAESAEWHRQQRAAARKSPRWPSHQRANARKRRAAPKRAAGDKFDTAAVRRAITRAAAKAFPPPAGLSPQARSEWRKRHSFHPHQLRHSWATNALPVAGPEPVRVQLGHGNFSTTEIYAQRDRAAVRELMRKIG